MQIRCLTAFVDSATEFITQPIRTIQNTLVQDKTSSNSVNKLWYNCQNRSQKHLLSGGGFFNCFIFLCQKHINVCIKFDDLIIFCKNSQVIYIAKSVEYHSIIVNIIYDC